MVGRQLMFQRKFWSYCDEKKKKKMRVKILEPECLYNFSSSDFTTSHIYLSQNAMLREMIPRGTSKSPNSLLEEECDRTEAVRCILHCLQITPQVESRNQGLDHERGQKQVHASMLPVQQGRIPMLRLYLVCIFVDTLHIANRRHSGLLPASYMQRNEIRKHRDLKTICPPNSYTTRQKTHCWIPAFTIVFPHKSDAS